MWGGERSCRRPRTRVGRRPLAAVCWSKSQRLKEPRAKRHPGSSINTDHRAGLPVAPPSINLTARSPTAPGPQVLALGHIQTVETAIGNKTCRIGSGSTPTSPAIYWVGNLYRRFCREHSQRPCRRVGMSPNPTGGGIMRRILTGLAILLGLSGWPALSSGSSESSARRERRSFLTHSDRRPVCPR
jgi:hypothetical protein